MKVNLGEEFSEIKINAKRLEDGSFDLSIKQIKEKEKGRPLSDIKPGAIVKIGEYNYIVLSHGGCGETALVSTQPIGYNNFGNDIFETAYENSQVRKFLNKDFYKKLCDVVGEKNIVSCLKVELKADDGTGKGKFVTDNVSLLTTNLYRKYRDFIPPTSPSWWTVTPSSYTQNTKKQLCYVDVNGVIEHDFPNYSHGLRPFFVLTGNAKVDDVIKED